MMDYEKKKNLMKMNASIGCNRFIDIEWFFDNLYSKI